ncbi:MAG: InlB B-repeat-containing protein [Clostridia bacterium]|nr:InlB B-repeat-containing protein [Clostridia bacterium]
MTEFRRFTAAFLAAVMLLFCLPFAASADEAMPDYNVVIKTGKYEGAEWTECTAFAPGDTVSVRVYLGTDFDFGSFESIFFFDKAFFTSPYGTYHKDNSVLNPYYNSSSDVYNAVQSENANITNLLVSSGQITEEESERYGWIYSSYERPFSDNSIPLNIEEYFYEFELTVNENAQGGGWVKALPSTFYRTGDSVKYLFNPTKAEGYDDMSIVCNPVITNTHAVIGDAASPETVTITFDANGGTITGEASTEYNYGALVTVPEVSAPEGVTFLGWYDTDDVLLENTDELLALKDETYKAKYSCTATFAADGEVVETIPFTSGDTQLENVPDVPPKTGYEGKWEDYTLGSENITVNARYTAIEYKAKFVADGTTVAEIPFTVNTQSITAPAVPAKAGYEGKWESYTLGTENITVNAQYTAIEYKAKFVSDGVTVAEIPFTVNTQSITPPAVPAKAGYNGKWESYTLGTENITVNAQYTAIEYKAKFVSDGVTVAEIPYTVNTQSITAPAVPAKAGYEGKWEDYALAIGGITVNAKYTVISALSVPASGQTVNYRNKVKMTAAANDIPDGYHVAWYDENGKVSDSETLLTGELRADATYTAKIVDNGGNVLKDAEGNDVSKSVTIKVNAGFFKRLIAFFRWLFSFITGGQPTVVLK